MKNLASISAVLLLAVLVTGCGGAAVATAAIPVEEIYVTQEPAVLETESPATEPPVFAGPLISPETIVLGGELLDRYLWGVEGNTFIFSFELLNTVNLQPGNVLVGEMTEWTPHGFLRKVTDLSSDGLSIRVETEPAVLEDVFIQADIVIDEIPLGSDDVEEFWEISGLQMMAMGIPGMEPRKAFSIKLKNVVVYDDDLDLDSKEDQVVVNGNIGIEPKFKFSTSISNQQLTDMAYLLTISESSELTVSSKVDLLDWIAPEPIPIAWYKFKPIIIWIDFVPVFVTPKLSLFIGMDGKISAEISTGIDQKANLTTGLIYRNGPNGDWDIITPMEGFQPDIPSYHPPEFQYDSEIVVYSRAQLQLMVYDMIGPTGKVDGYLKLKISPEPNWWKLYNGIKVNAGVTAEVFSHVWFEYSADIYEGEWLVDEAESAQTEPKDGPTTSSPSTDGEQTERDWSCWGGGILLAAILWFIYYMESKEE